MLKVNFFLTSDSYFFKDQPLGKKRERWLASRTDGN